jgi:hypothetical protein
MYRYEFTLVVLLKNSPVRLDHLHGHQLATLLLQTSQDGRNQTALDRVRLQHHQHALEFATRHHLRLVLRSRNSFATARRCRRRCLTGGLTTVPGGGETIIAADWFGGFSDGAQRKNNNHSLKCGKGDDEFYSTRRHV